MQEMDTATQALDGVKVADFTWAIAGPITTQMLAFHGARVVKIESIMRPDGQRTWGPFRDNIPGINRTAAFTKYNANKYGITLNLNHPKAAGVVRKLIGWADVVAENFTPGTMANWGLSYEDLIRIKPDIVMISMSARGQTGPLAQLPGIGPNLAGMSGLAGLCGWPDNGPSFIYGAYTDFLVPHFAIVTLVAALDNRRTTGKGQYIDLSQLACAIQFNTPLLLDYAMNGRDMSLKGNKCDHAAPHQIYRCRGQDRWCAIAVFDDTQWRALCNVIGAPGWLEDPRFDTLPSRKRNEDELDRLVEAWTVKFAPEEIVPLLQAAGVPAGTAIVGQEFFDDPQLKHRAHFSWLDHPEIGQQSYESPGFRLSGTPGLYYSPAPCLGQHNEYVYTELLGMPDEEFCELLNEGVFQ